MKSNPLFALALTATLICMTGCSQTAQKPEAQTKAATTIAETETVGEYTADKQFEYQGVHITGESCWYTTGQQPLDGSNESGHANAMVRSKPSIDLGIDVWTDNNPAVQNANIYLIDDQETIRTWSDGSLTFTYKRSKSEPKKLGLHVIDSETGNGFFFELTGYQGYPQKDFEYLMEEIISHTTYNPSETTLTSMYIQNEAERISARTTEPAPKTVGRTQDDMKETLEKKLPISNAWTAVQQRGKKEYPNGFDTHLLNGTLLEEAKDENTWSLKCKCTITNKYNAKQETTVEAQVTGDKDSPEVTQFYVYPV